jgi:hypothetical protein
MLEEIAENLKNGGNPSSTAPRPLQPRASASP